MTTYKVVHKKADTETVYLVTAAGPHAAKAVVLDSIYGERGNATAAKTCIDNGCSLAVTPFAAEEPYRLYAINTKTGAMS